MTEAQNLKVIALCDRHGIYGPQRHAEVQSQFRPMAAPGLTRDGWFDGWVGTLFVVIDPEGHSYS